VIPSEGRTAGIDAFTRAWTRVVTGHTVLRHSPHEVSALLERFARRFADALLAEPFTAGAGWHIGADLVGSGIATPELLGRTTTLIGRRFLEDVRLRRPDGRARLDELLGALATGYTSALIGQTVAAQEELRRAELDRGQRVEPSPARPHHRESLLRRLGETLAEHPRGRIGLCLINLDRFRTVNESLGYRAADQVLRTVAHRLDRLAERAGHFAAHLDNDTFVLLVADTGGPEEVIKAAEEALAAIAHTFPINNGYTLPIRASIGVVERPTAGTGPATLLGAAEQALRWAKRERRGQWMVYDTERAATETARHALSAEMPDALTRGEFVVDYQPLTDLRTGRMLGAEALVRWRHPVHGLLMPGRFIDLAEHTGLIVPLGEDVLRRACARAAEWRAAGPEHPVFVSVNVAEAQLRRPGLPALVRTILDETGLPESLLQLEVTENVLLDPEALGTLDDLARMGVRISLDDFGTGNCRLAEISNLPAHTIKIAGCFVRFLNNQHAATGPDHTVLTAMIELGRDLGLTVTVEGIETETQARRLRDLGCDIGQGYHLGRPRPAEEITALLGAAPN
jgi:diguanylate cyclase (GGDEF)-like protein